MYKIEALVNGQWDSSFIGHPDDNIFDTTEEAQTVIPSLIRAFRNDDPPPTKDDFRIIVGN